MGQETVTRFRFGHWEADIASGELFKSGRKVRIQRQPLKVLETLLTRAGQVVTREELREELWPGTHVEVSLSLNTALKKLRAVLGDNSRSPIYIETIPQHGYRFLQKRLILGPDGTDNAQGQKHSERAVGVRLAVLPFQNLEEDGKDWFGDGITEHIFAHCAERSNSIVVIAPPSALRYKHTSKSALQLCHELRSAYILTGSTLRSGGIVRVDAKLIGADQSCVWSHSYTYPEADILQGQDLVSQHIVDAIAHLLSPAAAPMPIPASVVGDHSQQGERVLPRGTEFGIQKSIAMFQEAIGLDASSGQAHAELGIHSSHPAGYSNPSAALSAQGLAFVVDADVRILIMNRAAANFLGNQDVTAVLGHRAGDVLRCLAAASTPEGCGRASLCRQCVIRSSVASCLEGHSVHRARARVEFVPEANQKPIDLLISATPMTSSFERLALLMLEDVTGNHEFD